MCRVSCGVVRLVQSKRLEQQRCSRSGQCTWWCSIRAPYSCVILGDLGVVSSIKELKRNNTRERAHSRPALCTFASFCARAPSSLRRGR